MTKTEANTKLAQLMGWTNIDILDPQAFPTLRPMGVRGDGETEDLPDFFSSRAAAAELVAWISKQESGLDDAFIDHLCHSLPAFKSALSLGRGAYYSSEILALLLATPEQITQAACAALDILLENKGATIE